jgi:hypothetical protein
MYTTQDMKKLATLCVICASSFSFGQAEYPLALWVAANAGNFTVANRPVTYPIDYFVIHVTQGSYAGAISWFQNPNSNVSAHYVIRSSDGQITQMLLHKDVGYHAGNWTYNTKSIGIEHEGFVADPNWFTAAMYNSSADLVWWASERHGVPRDRTRIIGHVEVPGATHTDPGPYWNWNYYMERVANRAEFISHNIPMNLNAGQVVQVSIVMDNIGDVDWLNSGSGQVRLATQNPAGHASPFYTAANWISNSRPAAPLVSPSLPGGSAEFRFFVTAPLFGGVYSETFQLHKDSIGYFGPPITFTVNVTTPETIYDNDHPDFELKGNWTTGTTAPGHFGADYKFTNTTAIESKQAIWNVEGIPNREYRVFAWWSEGTNRSTAAKYILNNGSSKPSVFRVNQQTSGGQWNYLGNVRMGRGGAAVILSNEAPVGFVVIADAIKLVPVNGR